MKLKEFICLEFEETPENIDQLVVRLDNNGQVDNIIITDKDDNIDLFNNGLVTVNATTHDKKQLYLVYLQGAGVIDMRCTRKEVV